MKNTTSILIKGLTLTFVLWNYCAMADSVDVKRDTGYMGDSTNMKRDTGYMGRGTKVEIPKTLAAIWAAVGEHQKELHDVVTANRFDEVQAHAFAVRDLVAAMPAKSNTLATEKKSSLKKSVARVADVAKQLDQAGTDRDSMKVATLTTKMDNELKTIEGLYQPKDLMQMQGTAPTGKQMCSSPMYAEVCNDRSGTCGTLLTMK